MAFSTSLLAAYALAAGADADAGKQLRDTFGMPNHATSEHFVLRWGDALTVGDDDVADVLRALEEAWAAQVVTMGFPPPAGSDTYRFNVYIGDSHPSGPPSYGSPGYFSHDPQGWPMNVLGPSLVREGGGLLDAVSAHEFFHALQRRDERFDRGGAGRWVYESTAEWAAVRTHPANAYLGSFVGAYTGQPELSHGHFAPVDAEDADALYAYGSFLFPLHLSEQLGDDVVLDLWTDPGDEPLPMEVLRSQVADEGLDLDELFLDHAARNVTWDYEPGDVLQGHADSLIDRLGLEPQLASYEGPGTDGVRTARGRAPRHYGYNVIRLRQPDAGTLSVTIDGRDAGTRDTPAEYGARLVRVRRGVPPEVLDVPFDDGWGELVVDDVGEERVIWLVVGAWGAGFAEEAWQDERFHYDYTLDIAPPGPDGGAADEPTGCSTSGGTLPAAAWLGALLGLVGRRRAVGIGALVVAAGGCAPQLGVAERLGLERHTGSVGAEPHFVARGTVDGMPVDVDVRGAAARDPEALACEHRDTPGGARVTRLTVGDTGPLAPGTVAFREPPMDHVGSYNVVGDDDFVLGLAWLDGPRVRGAGAEGVVDVLVAEATGDLVVTADVRLDDGGRWLSSLAVTCTTSSGARD